MTFFEVLTGLAFALFADAPVDAAVVEVGLGGTWDATNVLQAQTCVVLPVGLDHVPLLGTTVAEIAGEKAGIVHEGATVVLAAQPPEAAEVLLRRCVEVGATVAREGLEFGVVHRATAVGGQLLTLQGLSGTYDDVFLPLHGAHQAQNAAAALAAVEAFLGGASGGPALSTRRRCARASPASTAPGRLEVLRTSPTVLVDAGHNAARHGRPPSRRSARPSASPRSSASSPCSATRTPAGCSRCSSPRWRTSSSRRPARRARCPPTTSRELARDVFGEDRVRIEDRLDDAIDTAVALSESDAEQLGGAGVIVTGSVVTAGEARRLLARR